MENTLLGDHFKRVTPLTPTTTPPPYPKHKVTSKNRSIFIERTWLASSRSNPVRAGSSSKITSPGVLAPELAFDQSLVGQLRVCVLTGHWLWQFQSFLDEGSV